MDQLSGGRLQRAGGLEPRETDGLDGILFAPVLHGPWDHLLANTVPLLVFGFLLLLAGVRRWLAVTAMVWLVGGAGVWLTGGTGTLHIGASVLVFGWLCYLLLRGRLLREAGAAGAGGRAAARLRRSALGGAPGAARRLLAGAPLRRDRWRARCLAPGTCRPGERTVPRLALRVCALERN